jgi:hypothetical protein
MAYIVIRTVKGRQYRYLQISYREGGKVKTVSEYLGPVGGGGRAPSSARRLRRRTIERRQPKVIFDEEAMLREIKAKEALQEATQRAVNARFYLDTGLRMPAPNSNPMPIEKPVPGVAAPMARPVVAPAPGTSHAQSGPAPETATPASGVADAEGGTTPDTAAAADSSTGK